MDTIEQVPIAEDLFRVCADGPARLPVHRLRLALLPEVPELPQSGL